MQTELSEALHSWIHSLMRTSMKRMNLYGKRNGFSFSLINTLFRVHHKGSISITELSTETGVSTAATSQLIEKLVSQGLVRRIEDTEDRRNKKIDLTPYGHEVVQASQRERSGWLDELAQSFSDEEKELVLKAINLLNTKILEIEKREEIL